MSAAPMFLKIVVMLLMCSVCGTMLVGVISKDVLAFQIAGSCAALATILVLGYRINKKSGDA